MSAVAEVRPPEVCEPEAPETSTTLPFCVVRYDGSPQWIERQHTRLGWSLLTAGLAAHATNTRDREQLSRMANSATSPRDEGGAHRGVAAIVEKMVRRRLAAKDDDRLDVDEAVAAVLLHVTTRLGSFKPFGAPWKWLQACVKSATGQWLRDELKQQGRRAPSLPVERTQDTVLDRLAEQAIVAALYAEASSAERGALDAKREGRALTKAQQKAIERLRARLAKERPDLASEPPSDHHWSGCE